MAASPDLWVGCLIYFWVALTVCGWSSGKVQGQHLNLNCCYLSKLIG